MLINNVNAIPLESKRLSYEKLDSNYLSDKYVNWMNDEAVIEYIESGKFPPWESGNTDHYEVMVSGGPYDHTSSGAFNYCGSLTEVLFSMTPKIHAIGNYAFFECGNLEHFILPNSITYIAPQTFRNCGRSKSEGDKNNI